MTCDLRNEAPTTPIAMKERNARRAVHAARLAALRADVLANLASAQLSARTVGRRHGITERYVHKLFQQTGQTFGRFVQEVRLTRARELLTDPNWALKRINEIAAEVGFAEQSTFNRAFRRRFGCTPSAARNGQECAPPRPTR